MKNTKLIVFVSALLCAVMALSSCTGSAALPNNDVLANDPVYDGAIVPTESESTETPSIDTATTSGRLAVWQKYLGYSGTETDAVKSGNSVKLDTENYGIYWQNTNYGVTVMSKTSTSENNEDKTNPTETVTKTYQVYNIYDKDDSIFSYSSKITRALKSGVIISVSNEKVVEDVINSNFYGVFCVKFRNYTPIFEELPEGSTETPDLLEYRSGKVSYEFYLKDGTFIGASDYSYLNDYDTTSYTNTVFIGGFGYMLDNDGNFITKVAEELYTENPFVEATLGATEMYKVGTYYLVENSYQYKYFDLDGKPVADYTFGENDMIVLPNGNILTQTYVELYDGVTEYDVYDYESNTKYNIVTEIFDVASGKTTEVEFGYIIEDYYDVFGSGDTAIVDSLVIAGYSFENQMLASELTYLALNADLTVKEELPEIIPNQTGLIEVRDTDTILIPATMNGDEEFYYRVTDGNIFAFDYEIRSSEVSGILIVVDEDEDGNTAFDVIDYSGKVIVDNFNGNYMFMYNEDYEEVSVVTVSYDKEDESYSINLCYYNDETDTVVKKNLFSYDVADYSCDYNDFYMDHRVLRMTIYDREDGDYSVRFINNVGETISSFLADGYSGDTSESTTYYDNSNSYTVRRYVNYYNDQIVIRYVKSDSSEDFYRYTTIK